MTAPNTAFATWLAGCASFPSITKLNDMGRRGRTSSPISLFSFQDIVTSVTAIIILMTLMLAVELIHRKLSKAAQSTLTAVPLKTAIAQAEEEIKRLQQQLREVTGTSVEQAEVTAESLPREIHETKRQGAALREELETLHQQEAAARQAEQAALAEAFDRSHKQRTVEALERQTKEAQQAVALQMKANEEKRQQREDLKDSQRQGKRPGQRRIYNPAPGEEKQAWLVEVDEDLLRTAPLGRSKKPIDFRRGVVATASASFASWANGLSTADHYFVMLIRPNGIQTFQALSGALEADGFDLGFEVIAQDETVLDPEKGAGEDVP